MIFGMVFIDLFMLIDRHNDTGLVFSISSSTENDVRMHLFGFCQDSIFFSVDAYFKAIVSQSLDIVVAEMMKPVDDKNFIPFAG